MTQRTVLLSGFLVIVLVALAYFWLGGGSQPAPARNTSSATNPTPSIPDPSAVAAPRSTDGVATSSPASSSPKPTATVRCTDEKGRRYSVGSLIRTARGVERCEPNATWGVVKK
jgi:hypothetical protein